MIKIISINCLNVLIKRKKKLLFGLKHKFHYLHREISVKSNNTKIVQEKMGEGRARKHNEEKCLEVAILI